MKFIRQFWFFVTLLSLLAVPARAQDEAVPKEKQGIQLEFIPPPMQGGTISLGIYDPAGKLIRVLHQEAQPADFFAALNGLITYWDGKDDSGKLMPAGKYRARGYMVGAMDFEGVAFLGNDWVSGEDSPRIKTVTDISCDAGGNLQLLARQPDNTFLRVSCNASGDITGKEPIEKSAALEASAPRSLPAAVAPILTPLLGTPVDDCVVRDKSGTDSLWVIDRSKDDAFDIKQFSLNGEFKRHLPIQPNDPVPQKIAASQTSDTIFLLEVKAGLQRVRALTLLSNPVDTASASPVSASPAKSTWKVVFSKTIRSSDTLDQVGDLLKMPSGKTFAPQEKIRLTLLPNPLEQDKTGAVEISIGVDAKGSFLKAGDGLPLCRVSETPNLRWAAMSGEAGSKVITIFQSDGAVIEQFKAARLANMMAFDCGDFDFDPARIK